MKKILAAFCSLLLLFTCACAPNNPAGSAQPVLPASFEGDCTVNYQDMEIQAHIQRPDTHNCKITVTAPESLKGVCVDYSDGVINLSYGIIKQTLDITKIPQAAFAPAIIHALDSIAAYQEQNAAPANADGDYVLNMNSEFGDFTVTLEETTGAIKSIEIPSYQVKVTFSTFTPLSEA